ncbi:hypothetical protein NSP_21610 [Nodularia spumigena CCY9414]|nr:hypothetical protein NSP_21610 [Nodularia spumigena CCY9414]
MAGFKIKDKWENQHKYKWLRCTQIINIADNHPDCRQFSGASK